MTFLPDPAVLLAYSLACFVLFITPGPDMSLFLAKTVSGGRQRASRRYSAPWPDAASIRCSRRSACPRSSPRRRPRFTILKIVGALYLLWLAVDAIRHGSALSLRDEAPGQVSVRRTFLLGVGINLTNPKVVLFFVTFLPQFVSADDPHAAGKLLFLGLYFIAFSAPLAALLILGAERVIALLKSRPRVLRAIDYTFAGLFGVFALKSSRRRGGEH